MINDTECHRLLRSYKSGPREITCGQLDYQSRKVWKNCWNFSQSLETWSLILKNLQDRDSSQTKNSIIDIRFSKLDSGVAKHRFSILDPRSLWKALLAFLNLSLWNWLRLITFSFISLAYRWEHSKTVQQTVGWQTDVHVVGEAGFSKSFMVNTGVWGTQGVRSVQSNGRKDRKFVWWSD